jgi:hypothetical protein
MNNSTNSQIRFWVEVLPLGLPPVDGSPGWKMNLDINILVAENSLWGSFWGEFSFFELPFRV